MSVENLTKNLEIIHEQIRAESDVSKKLELMQERDQIMKELVQARRDEAAYHLKQIQELEEKNRAKTFQSPFKF